MYDITHFGAIADGKTLATNAIQSAIDTCAKNGGGKVFIPAGCFLSGSLFLKDNVELHLDMGAILKASTRLEDYNADDAYPQNYGSLAEEWLGKHLIMAVECRNVAITGLGKIDGSGDAFFEEPRFYPYYPWMTGYGWRNGISYAKDKNTLRPGQLICFIESENITLRDFTIVQSPCWSIFLHGCSFVSVSGIRVFNPCFFGNTDGIDVDCCRFVTISDCIIHTGDDAIAIRCAAQRLKKQQPCEYITVSNCTLSSYASGIRIGVGTGQIRHVRLNALTIEKAGSAINYITSYSGKGCAQIEDVNFSDISLYDVCFPLQMKGNVGCVKDVSIENIRAYAMCGIKLIAHEDCRIQNIRLQNLDLHLIPEEQELTDRRLSIRGDALIELNGLQDVFLDNVQFHSSSELLATWKACIRQTSCKNIRVNNCELPL